MTGIEYMNNVCPTTSKGKDPNKEDVADAFEDGIAEGFKQCKQDLMKDAVEGLVVCDELTHGHKDIAMAIPDNLNVGDKVKLIIIKEE